jgi:hypothetical protein
MDPLLNAFVAMNLHSRYIGMSATDLMDEFGLTLSFEEAEYGNVVAITIEELDFADPNNPSAILVARSVANVTIVSGDDTIQIEGRMSINGVVPIIDLVRAFNDLPQGRPFKLTEERANELCEIGLQIHADTLGICGGDTIDMTIGYRWTGLKDNEIMYQLADMICCVGSPADFIYDSFSSHGIDLTFEELAFVAGIPEDGLPENPRSHLLDAVKSLELAYKSSEDDKTVVNMLTELRDYITVGYPE